MGSTTNARYLLIGSGRTAKHFKSYFQALNIPFDQWSRALPHSALTEKIANSSHILLLISDSAIADFYQKELKQSGKTVVHFSGALLVKGCMDAHPLMSFGPQLYDLDFYKKIPFVTTSEKNFSEILPGLPNSHFHIQPKDKAYYHSLCVLAGNYTTLLWQKMASGLESLGLPPNLSQPYMEIIFQNLKSGTKEALTGPLARHDLVTIQKNIAALKNDNYLEIYKSFVAAHWPEVRDQI